MTALPKGTLPSDVRSAAGYYLQHGYVPVPIPRVGRCKAPILDGWQRLRPSLQDLQKLFPEEQALNLGLLSGQPSDGLIDIDLDSAEAIAAGALLLPPTGWVSGRRSKPQSHWWYRVQAPPDKAQDPYRDLDGTMLVEVHSTRWQVIVPPSLHESGESVVWHQFRHPAEIPMTDLLQATRAVAAVALLGRHWPEKGVRQDCFLALVGGLLRSGMHPDRVERLVEALATVTNDEEHRKRDQTVLQTYRKLEKEQKITGWPRLEELLGSAGREVVRRVRTWLGLLQRIQAGSKARMLEPYVPFPVEALPVPLAEYVRQGAAALGCDPAYLALPVLAVAAAAIGNTRTIRLKRGWEEACILWAATVGDSGTLKTPAYLKAVAQVFRLQKRLLDEYKQLFQAYQEQEAEYQAAKRRAKQDGSDPGEAPEEPLLKRLVCSDTTVEKLAEILEDNPRGTLLARDELNGWLTSFTRYKGKQGGTDLPNWLEMFRAGTLVVDRKTGDRKTLFVARAAVSVTGSIQPGVLSRSLTPEFLDAGLGARLLMAMPPKVAKRWSEDEIAPEAEQAYHAVLDGLLDLDFELNGDGEKVPYVLHLAPEAKAVWVAFYREWAQQQAQAEGELAAAYAKLEAYAARFALLHHVVSHIHVDADDRRPVGTRSVEAGIALARWFAREARRIYRTLTESTEERETRRLVEFIRGRGGKITVKDLQHTNSRKYPTAEAAEAALEGLVQAEWGGWVERAQTAKGGRPTRDFFLQPTIDDTDETSGDDKDGDGGQPVGPSDETPPRPTIPPAADPGPGSEELPQVVEMQTHKGGADRGPTNADQGFVGIVDSRMQERAERNGVGHRPEASQIAGEVSSDTGRVSSGAPVFQVTARGESMSPPYLLIEDPAGLDLVRTALDNTAVVGLDLETTGLDPHVDRIRLLSLAVETIDGGTFSYLIDCFAVDPTPLWEVLAAKDLVLHNAAFDLGFLSRQGFTPGTVHDTMLLAQLLSAGTNQRCSLAACVERELGMHINKEQQRSDWGGALTVAQLTYAARDVQVLPALFEPLSRKIDQASLTRAAEIERRCLPAIVWMAVAGVPFDRDAWQRLAEEAQTEAKRLMEQLDTAAPARPGQLLGRWNWDSPAQVKEALGTCGISVAGTDDDTLAGINHPLAQLLRQYRDARKRTTTYGSKWLEHVRDDGRVYPAWRQIGAASGRMSCSQPNMQQLPRGPYRRCIAAPAGRVLIKADYSQIELRIAARVSGDPALREAYQRGEDLHVRTARSVLGVAEVTKQDRQLAKALNFGLLYGMGARGFQQYARSQYGLDLTVAEARRYRDAFFQSYPGLAAWHRRVRAARAQETRTLDGRRRLLDTRTPDTQRLNTPVQGSGADGLKMALALLWERRQEVAGVRPVLAVHDEIVVECGQEHAEAVGEWLKKAMVDAMAPLLEPVPVEVEVQRARNWEGTESGLFG